MGKNRQRSDRDSMISEDFITVRGVGNTETILNSKRRCISFGLIWNLLYIEARWKRIYYAAQRDTAQIQIMLIC